MRNLSAIETLVYFVIFFKVNNKGNIENWFKVSNKDNKAMYKICSKLTITK